MKNIQGKIILNIVNGKKLQASKKLLKKINPHNGKIQKYFVNSNKTIVNMAVDVAHSSHCRWSQITPIARGKILSEFVSNLKNESKSLASMVASETGKSLNHALGEVAGAILQGEFLLVKA
jgi:acyl-CoA reductase-like NAD-dependent aldehyde dehydrogenase